MNFFKSFSVYAVSSFIDKGVAFFLLPVFTYYLTPTDYGTLSLITTFTAFLTPFITLGTAGAISSNYFQLNRTEYPSYFSSTIIPSLTITSFLFLFLILGGGKIVGQFWEIPSGWLILIPIVCFCDFIRTITLVNFQVKAQVFRYSTTSLSYSFLNIILSLSFVIIYNMGYTGRLTGQYISSFAICIFLLVYLKRSGILSKKINKQYIKDCLSFGLPLIPHTIGSLIINMSDRIFIDKLVGKEELGIYNVGYTIGSILTIVNMAFSNTIVPYSFERFTKNDQRSKEEVVKIYWLYIAFLAISTIIIFIVAPYIFKYFIDNRYHEGVKYVYWITAAYASNGVYLLFANIIFYLKKTKILLYMSFFNILLNLSLNYFLILYFGTIGAAYATFITFFTFTILIIYFTSKQYKLPWLYFITNK